MHPKLLGVLQTLRNHWKKSTALVILGLAGSYYGRRRYRLNLIRRETCQRAQELGNESLASPMGSPRRMIVLLNPAVEPGNARKLFEKNALPVLNLAGIDVTVIESTYEGHLRVLMEYVDPKLSGVIIAGGDGSVQSAVTGLLRRVDQDMMSRVPIGVIPLGKNNRFASSVLGAQPCEVRRVCESALAIALGQTRPVDVMAFHLEDPSQPPTFAMSDVQWGLFRDTNATIDQYKWTGRLRGLCAYSAATLKEKWPFCREVQVLLPMEKNKEKCVKPAAERIESSNSSGVWGWFSWLWPSRTVQLAEGKEEVLTSSIMRPSVPRLQHSLEQIDGAEKDAVEQPVANMENSEPLLYATPSAASDSDGGANLSGDAFRHMYADESETTWHGQPLSTVAVRLQAPLFSDEKDRKLALELWPADIPKNQFIKHAWRKYVLRSNESEVVVSSVKIETDELWLAIPPNEESWFSVDGELFEARTFHVKLLRDKLRVFHMPKTFNTTS